MDCLDIVEKYFTLKKRNIGKFARVRAKKYLYKIDSYELEGYGVLSIIDEPGFLGLVHIYTVVITPFEVDAPIFMCENLKIPMRRILIAELFDSQLTPRQKYDNLEQVKENHPNLDKFVPSIQWPKIYTYDESYYVAVLKKKSAEFNEAWAEYLEEYCKVLKDSPKCDPQLKKAKDNLYIDDLLKYGGPQRDHLLKAYDIKYISRLYKEGVFATEAKD